MSTIEIKYAKRNGEGVKIQDYDFFDTYKYQIDIDETDKDKHGESIKQIYEIKRGK